MLTSITPLGERSRGNRWWLTTAALVLGCVLAGAGAGALAGGLGDAILSGVSVAWRLALVAAALAAGLLLDLADAHPDAGVDVARGEHRHLEGRVVVRRIGKIAAAIEVASRGAADMTAEQLLVAIGCATGAVAAVRAAWSP